MDEVVARWWDMLIDRGHGLLHLRFLVQPLVAAMLAIRAGLRDAREHRPPFGWAVLVGSGHRGDLLREGWNDVAMLFIAAVVIDVVYQLIVFRWVHPVQALIVAAIVALPAYLLVRGPVNRMAQLWLHNKL